LRRVRGWFSACDAWNARRTFRSDERYAADEEFPAPAAA
jgi:hypothetical protein